MREILFRGKTLATESKWVEGFYNHIPCGRFLCDEHCIQTIAEDGRIGQLYTVYESTVGQFTGRTDKNGKKVFEHDILQIYTVWADGTVEKAGTGIVRWWENDQCYVLTTEEGYHIDDFGNYGRPEYFEVIGNIYEF